MERESTILINGLLTGVISKLPNVLTVTSNKESGNVTGDTNSSVAITSMMAMAVQPRYYLEEHFGLMVITAIVIGAAAIIGTLGNILVISAVCCVRALRTTGNIFVLNLALADMIVTVLVDPFNVVGAVAGRSVLVADDTLCNFVAAFCGPACLSSMWNMCAISINRYFFICKPHLYPKFFTFKLSILYCIGIWILAHLLHMPNHIGWGKNRFSPMYYICSFDMETHSYGIFYMTGVIIPLIGVLVGYAAIYRNVRNVKLQIRQYRLAKLLAQVSVQPSSEPVVDKTLVDVNGALIKYSIKKPNFTREDVKLAQTLFIAFFTFLISWSLVVIFVLAHDPSTIPGWLFVVAVIMAHGNSAVNPVLYGMANKKFRDGYRSVLRLRCARGVGDFSVTQSKPLHTKSPYGSLDLPDSLGENSIKTRRSTLQAVPEEIRHRESGL